MFPTEEDAVMASQSSAGDLPPPPRSSASKKESSESEVVDLGLEVLDALIGASYSPAALARRSYGFHLR